MRNYALAGARASLPFFSITNEKLALDYLRGEGCERQRDHILFNDQCKVGIGLLKEWEGSGSASDHVNKHRD